MSRARVFYRLILSGTIIAAFQAGVVCIWAADASRPDNQPGTSTAASVEQLQNTVTALQDEVTLLKAQMAQMQAAMAATNQADRSLSHDLVDVAPQGSAGDPGDPSQQGSSSLAETPKVASLSSEDRGILDYLKGSTINVMVDGYYEYNFNDPVGRVNVLRAYDVLQQCIQFESGGHRVRASGRRGREPTLGNATSTCNSDRRPQRRKAVPQTSIVLTSIATSFRLTAPTLSLWGVG